AVPRLVLVFLFLDTAPPHISPLSLHDALPILKSLATRARAASPIVARSAGDRRSVPIAAASADAECAGTSTPISPSTTTSGVPRSEEHTSELQSLRHLVCRLLLEKKKKNKKTA